ALQTSAPAGFGVAPAPATAGRGRFCFLAENEVGTGRFCARPAARGGARDAGPAQSRSPARRTGRRGGAGGRYGGGGGRRHSQQARRRSRGFCHAAPAFGQNAPGYYGGVPLVAGKGGYLGGPDGGVLPAADRRGNHPLRPPVPALRQGRRLRRAGVDRHGRHRENGRLLLQRDGPAGAPGVRGTDEVV
ncbi:MAG: Septum formation protein Maf, partial [uncultured Cytophagales bacterium]